MEQQSHQSKSYLNKYTNELSKTALILPPGTLMNENIYGSLTIQIGKIIYLNTAFPFENTKLRIKFWGQSESICLVAQNCSKELKPIPALATYDIRTPLILFYQYLKDMVKLKIEVLDKRNDKIIGVIIVNLLTLLNQNVTEKSLQVFDSFSHAFAILKPQIHPMILPPKDQGKQMVNLSEQIGEVEISMSNEFKIKPVRDLGDYEKMKTFLNDEKNINNIQNPQQNYFEEQRMKILELEKQKKLDHLNRKSDQNLNIQVENKLKENIQDFQNIVNEESKTKKKAKIQIQEIDSQDEYEDIMEVSQIGSKVAQRKTKQKEQQNQKKNPKNVSSEKKQKELSTTDYQDYEQKQMDMELKQKQIEIDQKELFYKSLQQKQDSENNEQRILKERAKNVSDQLISADLEIFQLQQDEAELIENPNFDLNQRAFDPQENPGVFKQKLLREIQRMKIHIFSFRLTNPLYKQRFKDKKVFIEIEIPAFAQNKQLIYNKVTLAQKEERNQEWFYNQEYPQQMQFNESNLNTILQAPIGFKIIIEDHNKDRSYFGQGKFMMQKILMEDLLRSEYVIKIENNEIPVAIPKKKGPAQEVRNQDIGEIYVEICLDSGQQQIQQRDQMLKFYPQDEGICQMYMCIDSASNFQPQNIAFSYKLLATNQKIETDFYKISTNKFQIDHKIIQPIFPQTVLKLKEIPYIIEVWKIIEDKKQFLGVAKINLQQIFKTTVKDGTFSLDTINENPNPLIILQNDDIIVEDLKTQTKLGLLNFTISFGTIPQITKFEDKLKKNKPQIQNQTIAKDDINIRIQESPQIMSPQLKQYPPYTFQQQPQVSQHLQFSNKSAVSNQKIANQVNDTITPLKSFIQILEQIRRNKKKFQQQLKNFVIQSEKQNQKVSLREFYDFVNKLNFVDAHKESYIQKLIQLLDFAQSDEIFVPDFTKSFSSYISYEDIVRDQLKIIVQDFQKILAKKKWTYNDLDRHINRYSDFGFIQKQKFVQLLQTITDDEGLIDRLLYLTDPSDEGLIQASLLSDYVRNSEIHNGISQFNPEVSYFVNIVKENLQDYLIKNQQILEDFINGSDDLYDKVFSVRDVMDVIESLGLEISFWESLCIVTHIKEVMRNDDDQDQYSVSFTGLIDYFNYLVKKIDFKQLPNESNEWDQQRQQDEDLELVQILKNQ